MRWVCRRARSKPSADPEALRNIDDFWIHGRHPSGRLIAAEVWDVVKEECCVWDLETGDLVWRPRARSISWSQDGAAVALLVGEYGDDFELRSWPERELTSRCVVRPWACCNTYVSLSPRGDRAGVLWWHQTEGGVNLVSLEDGAARHLESGATRRGKRTRSRDQRSARTAGSSRSQRASRGGGCRNRATLLKPSRLREERSNVAASPSSTSIQRPTTRSTCSARSKRVGFHLTMSGSASSSWGSLASPRTAKSSSRPSSAAPAG